MKKTGKWVGAIAAIVLVATVLAMLAFEPLAERRGAAFEPLSEDVLRAIMSDGSSKGTTAKVSGREGSRPAVPVPIAPESMTPEPDGGASDPSRNLPRLSRTLSRADILGLVPYKNNSWENVYLHFADRGLKIVESLAWATDTDTDGSKAYSVGQAALLRGDIEEARDYLRAALAASTRHENYSLRNDILAGLASVEEDPEVATALLEASCMPGGRDRKNVAELPFYLQNALCLSILTGSDALAEHYYARWDALEPGGKHIWNPHLQRGASDQISAWMETQDPDFFENSTRGSPGQVAADGGSRP